MKKKKFSYCKDFLKIKTNGILMIICIEKQKQVVFKRELSLQGPLDLKNICKKNLHEITYHYRVPMLC